MSRILAVADEVEEALYGTELKALEPDLVVACGDLPFDYLEYIVTILGVPLLYVLGNHDPDLRAARTDADRIDIAAPLGYPAKRQFELGPQGCLNVDGRLASGAGLVVAGLGGSARYKPGPNQYSQAQMKRRALRLEARARLRRRRVDLLITHAAPLGVGDEDDPCHRGFEAFHGFVSRLRPRFLIHGHIHPHGTAAADRTIGETRIVNAVGHRILEI